MSPRLLPALGLLLAGCAAPSGVAVPDAHPASASALGTPLLVAAGPLAPPPAPDLPAALRPHPDALASVDHSTTGASRPHDGEMDHAGMDHAGMDMGGEMPASRPDEGAIRSALDAYLAVHDALAEDRFEASAAADLARGLEAWTGTPPPGDAHLWHRLAADVEAARSAAADLAAAGGLEAARAAFGALSVPFARLVEAAGVPDGYDLDRFRCGMADVAAGGVWLQPAGDAENPYVGASMRTCGTRDAAAPEAGDAAPMSHDGMDHGAMGHGTHR